MSLLDKIVSHSLPIVPKAVVRVFARPYIAGETLADQIREVRAVNEAGYMAASGILGEFVTRKEESAEAVESYIDVLNTIQEVGLDSNIHVKPTHLGLKIDWSFCLDNIRRLADHAGDQGNFVRIDMEDSPTVDDTLKLYFSLREQGYDNVGLVIQACLRRSIADIQRLKDVKANVRLCKGIYVEPHDIAYRDRSIVQENYAYLLDELLSGGCYVGIATHDERLIWEATRIVRRLGLTTHQYEFQMLHGVMAQLRRIVIGDGHRLRVAVPFGPSWYPYSVRRLRKNPAIAGYVLKAMFSRG